MARVEIGRYLATDSRVCKGRLIFKCTRILVSDAMELLRAGLTPEQISQEYRGIVKPAAVREAQTLATQGYLCPEGSTRSQNRLTAGKEASRIQASSLHCSHFFFRETRIALPGQLQDCLSSSFRLFFCFYRELDFYMLGQLHGL